MWGNEVFNKSAKSGKAWKTAATSSSHWSQPPVKVKQEPNQQTGYESQSGQERSRGESRGGRSRGGERGDPREDHRDVRVKREPRSDYNAQPRDHDVPLPPGGVDNNRQQYGEMPPRRGGSDRSRRERSRDRHSRTNDNYSEPVKQEFGSRDHGHSRVSGSSRRERSRDNDVHVKRERGREHDTNFHQPPQHFRGQSNFDQQQPQYHNQQQYSAPPPVQNQGFAYGPQSGRDSGRKSRFEDNPMSRGPPAGRRDTYGPAGGFQAPPPPTTQMQYGPTGGSSGGFDNRMSSSSRGGGRDRDRDREVDRRDDRRRGERDNRSSRRKRSRSRSRSRPRIRRPHRSWSRSNSRSNSPGGARKRKEERRRRREARKTKKSNFDVAPTGFDNVPEQQKQKLIQQMTIQQQSGFSGGQSSVTAQQTRHARRIYVGGVSGVGEGELLEFWNSILKKGLGQQDGQNPVFSVYINHEKKFAFVELHSVDLTSACMELDGIQFRGQPLKIRRPNDYNPALAPAPREPIKLDLKTMGFKGGEQAPQQIYIGGLPVSLNERDVKQLVESFGDVDSVHLIREPGELSETKGYGFITFDNDSEGEDCIRGLDGFELDDKHVLELRVSDHNKSSGMARMAKSEASTLMDMAKAVKPTRVLVFFGLLKDSDLENKEEFFDILDDVKANCEMHGEVREVFSPEDGPGKLKVFVRFVNEKDAESAANDLTGRSFKEEIVMTEFFDLSAFNQRDFSEYEKELGAAVTMKSYVLRPQGAVPL
eukprot:TRINITY_DN1493_c3_g1_i1.p1 TRINITY_DN1493_c3_g1~~TRINITY_DN1493_c3_g1_i1.p1  ORF type:complete len:761 (+),score=263.06 TRINITY_DN1493_c3_g1_i1:127-2409(+)